MKRILAATAAAAVFASMLMASVPAEAAMDCAPIEVIAARGTSALPQGENLTSADYENAPFKGTGPEADTVAKQISKKLPKDENGKAVKVPTWGVRYPAAGTAVIGVAVKDPAFEMTSGYTLGVLGGARSTRDRIKSRTKLCAETTDTRFVLVGYSQGADVIATAITELTKAQKARVAAVVLFADPHFNENDVVADRGSFEPNHSGLSGRRSKWSKRIDAPVYSYCGAGDIACNSMTDSPVYLESGERTSIRVFDGAFVDKKNPGDPFKVHGNIRNTNAPKNAGTWVADVVTDDCSASSTTQPSVSMSGPTQMYASDQARFSTAGSKISLCQAFAWDWSVPEAVATSLAYTELLPDGSLGATHGGSVATAQIPSSTNRFTPTFSGPGYHPIEATLHTPDWGVRSVQREVLVLADPVTAPAVPDYTSSLTLDGLRYEWTQPIEPGADVEFYSILDAAGTRLTSKRLTPDNVNQSGESHFTWTSAVSGDGPFTLVAENRVGHTAGRRATFANSADYRYHASTDADANSLVVKGDGDLGVTDPAEATISGDIVFTSNEATNSAGSDELEASLEIGATGWTISVHFAGSPLEGPMSAGAAEALLGGGTIDLTVNDTLTRVRISSGTTVTHDDRYVINSNADVPSASITTSNVFGSIKDSNFAFWTNGSYAAFGLPAWSENPDIDPFAWSDLPVTDIHTYIGQNELANTLQGYLGQALEPTTTENYSIYWEALGAIGDGKTETLRSFVRSGVITFRVNGGAVNVVRFDATQAQAEEAFPTPHAPVIDASAVPIRQYRETNWWANDIVDWGPDGRGTIEIAVPTNGSLNGGTDNQGMTRVSGAPSQTGTIAVEITATNATGSTTAVIPFNVLPSYADSRYYIGSIGRLLRQSNGTLEMLDMRRDWVMGDNANMVKWLPAVYESGIARHFPDWYSSASFNAVDAHIYKEDGTEVPFTGDLKVTLRHSLYDDGEVSIYSNNLQLADNTSATVNALWKTNLRITFRMSDGSAVNEVWHSKAIFTDVDKKR
ncbi:cutinase family protein [Schumannella soli]|uniref:cutinase family protein n=1 Tax=Schumannella soli TaxID=2590779 RepID=UPI0015E82F09|nr:cutinase family protein [Schumannella soli]